MGSCTFVSGACLPNFLRRTIWCYFLSGKNKKAGKPSDDGPNVQVRGRSKKSLKDTRKKRKRRCSSSDSDSSSSDSETSSSESDSDSSSSSDGRHKKRRRSAKRGKYHGRKQKNGRRERKRGRSDKRSRRKSKWSGLYLVEVQPL